MTKQLKPSGVHWIRDIPTGWGLTRLKDFCRVSGGGVDKVSREHDLPTKMINYLDVYKSKTKRLNAGGRYMETTATRHQIFSAKVRCGDALITPSSETSDDIGHMAVVEGEPQGNLVFSYHLARVRVEKLNFHVNYLCYWVNSTSSRNYYSSISGGTTRKTLTHGDIGSLVVPVPSRDEQIAIANYLDKATAVIDKQKALLERKKELLQEQKKALIHQAVTKGLDPSVPMKPSGVDWIGDVPVGWANNRLKDLADIKNGDWGDDPINEIDGMICYRKADFSSDSLVYSGATRRLIQRMPFVVSGDILIEKSGGGDVQPVGAVAFVVNETPSACSNFLARLRAKSGVNPKWLFWFLSAQYHSNFIFNLFKQTTGIQNLEMPKLLASSFPCPSLAEQLAISAYIDRIALAIDSQTECLKRKISLLDELRASAIHDAVTKGVPKEVSKNV